MNSTKSKFIVYGTLRPGEYNFSHFKDGLKHLGSGKIKGYKLYNLGAYPCAVETGDEEDTIIVDVLEAQDNLTGRMIDGMEMGAGYHAAKAKTYLEDGSEEDFKIYLFKEAQGEHIPGGDWMNKYKKGNRKKSFDGMLRDINIGIGDGRAMVRANPAPERVVINWGEPDPNLLAEDDRPMEVEPVPMNEGRVNEAARDAGPF